MIVEELLDHTRKEYLDDFTELLEGDDDRLWSDEVLCRHFNEGSRILCRRAWLLIETGVAPAGVISLVEGKTVYSLHKSVLRVYKATPADTEFRLGRVSEEALDTRLPADPETPFDINTPDTTTPGYPRAIATDAGTRRLRVYPAPSADEAGLKLNLKIARLPLRLLSVDDIQAHPELDEQWHESLCKYAAGKCLTSPKSGDVDARTQGREWLKEFYDDVKLARQERMRAEMAPVRIQHASSTAYI